LIADLYPVNRRYLNNDNFERKSKVDNPFQKSVADNYILQDKDPDYRVLDLTKNIFNDASTSYFHKSIGGYHGAKLQRYQDLIEYYLSSEIQGLLSVLKSNPSPERIDQALNTSFALNMLNTKYIIFNPGVNPIENRFAFGHAWSVNDFKLVENADKEIAETGKTDLKTTAVIDKRFADQVQGKTFNPDASATIELKSYAPNKLVYDFESSKDQLIVFSEIYYDKGWDAFIDGEKSPYLRADYVLRAMVIPAGKHTVEFKFEPKIWTIGNVVSLISSLLLLILVVAVLAMETKKAFAKGNE